MMKNIFKKAYLFIFVVISILTTIILVSFAYSKGWEYDGADWYYLDEAGVPYTDTFRMSGDDKYYLNIEGKMVRDFLYEDGDSTYYFDDDGKMVRSTWVAVEPYQVENKMESGPTIYLYYFGTNGKAFRAKNGIVKKTIDGKKYLFNENGQMLSGWINENGEIYNDINSDQDPFMGYCYYAGDETDGVLKEGFYAFEDGSVQDEYYQKETLWFYFQRGTCKKVASNNSSEPVKKVLNGHTYAFDINGVAIEGWDSDMVLDMQKTKNHFSETRSEHGQMSKGKWVYTVPSKLQHFDDHEAETERWFYLMSGGGYVEGVMKKINGEYYAFNNSGIMKKGLCIIERGTKKYVDCIDMEKTDGKDFIISRHYISMDEDRTLDDLHNYSSEPEFKIFDDVKDCIFYFNDDESAPDFGRKIKNQVTASFGDNDYTFVSNNVSENEGLKNKKYFQCGLRLEAATDLGLGLVFLGYSASISATAIKEKPMYLNSTHPYAKPDVNHNNIKSDYIVLKNMEKCQELGVYPVYVAVDQYGNQIKKSNSVKKDKSDRYWMIGPGGYFVQAFDIPIRYTRSGGRGRWQFKSEFNEIYKSTPSVIYKSKTRWKDFYDIADNPADSIDIYGKTCYTTRRGGSLTKGGYEIDVDENYATNFRYED